MKKILAIFMAALMLAFPAAAADAGEPVVTSVEEETVAVPAETASVFKLYVLNAADNTIIGYIDDASQFQLVSATLYGVDAVALVVDQIAEGYSISYNGAELGLGVISAPIAVDTFTSINWILSYAIEENLTMQYSNFLWIFGYPDNYVDVTAYITDAEGNTISELVLTNEVIAKADSNEIIVTEKEIPADAKITFFVNADRDVAVTINGTAVNGYSEAFDADEIDDFKFDVTIGKITKTVTYTLNESIHPISKHFLYGLAKHFCG